MSRIREKYTRLKEIIAGLDRVAVGFSGGVDSTFLLAVCCEVLGSENVHAITAESVLFSSRERADAAAICQTLGIKQHIISICWKDIEPFAHNPADRCYFCKRTIFGKITQQAQSAGINAVFDGTNADDMMDYRPGERALRELSVMSPLCAAGLCKQDIRELSKGMGLFTWEKPAFACLASRIPYGEEITEEKLASIGKAEQGLHELGFEQVRVRHHGDVARIEVLPEDRRRFSSPEIMDQADKLVKQAGFRFASLDLGGYRMGNLNPQEGDSA